jgi:hypothetical protein
MTKIQGQRQTKDKIISNVVIAVTVVITAWAMWYIYHQMNKVKPEIIYERRKARYFFSLIPSIDWYSNTSAQTARKS